MTAKVQTPPPFGQPKPNEALSESKDETLTTLGDTPTQEVPGLSDAVDEELKGELDTEGKVYWASGGTNVGGLELGNFSKPARPFDEQPVNPKNPFQRKEVAPPVKAMELFEVPSGTPSWRELVTFVCEHGKDIVRVRFPNAPRNEEMITEMARMDAVNRNRGGEVSAEARPCTVIDTIWKGIPVWNEGKCQIEHIKYGWTDWEDCQ